MLKAAFRQNLRLCMNHFAGAPTSGRGPSGSTYENARLDGELNQLRGRGEV
jgi:hypothetical protein